MASITSLKPGGGTNGGKRKGKKRELVKREGGVRIFEADSQFPSCNPQTEVSIATFNILQKNFNFSKKPWVSPEHASWEYRKMLIHDTLSTLNTDIVCLQEADIDTFESDFAVYMGHLGYDMVPPSVKTKRDTRHGHTKPSIFFKRDKFTLHWHNPRSRTTLIALEIKNSSGADATAVGASVDTNPLVDPVSWPAAVEEERISSEESKDSLPSAQYGQMVYVANCHLQCGGSAGGVNVHHTRTLQMRSALRRMRWHMIRHDIDLKDVALFVCGDFNCPPSDPVCQLLTRGYNTPEEIDQYFKGNDLAFENEIHLADSHHFLKETRRKFPTFVRQHKSNNFTVGLTMDYIFYTPHTMRLEAIRDPFSKNWKSMVRRSGLIPNEWHPSDHLPLVAKFIFDKTSQNLSISDEDPANSSPSRKSKTEIEELLGRLDDIQGSLSALVEKINDIQDELYEAQTTVKNIIIHNETWEEEQNSDLEDDDNDSSAEVAKIAAVIPQAVDRTKELLLSSSAVSNRSYDMIQLGDYI